MTSERGREALDLVVAPLEAAKRVEWDGDEEGSEHAGGCRATTRPGGLRTQSPSARSMGEQGGEGVGEVRAPAVLEREDPGFQSGGAPGIEGQNTRARRGALLAGGAELAGPCLRRELDVTGGAATLVG